MLRRALDVGAQAGTLALRAPPSWLAGMYHTSLGRLDEAQTELPSGYWPAPRRTAWSTGGPSAAASLATIAARRATPFAAAELAPKDWRSPSSSTCRTRHHAAVHCSAWAAVQLGEADKGRELAASGLELAEQAGDPAYVLLHQALPGSLDLASGDVAARRGAFPGADRPAGGHRPAHDRPSLAADTMEALIAAGEPDQAAIVVAELGRMMHSPVTAARWPAAAERWPRRPGTWTPQRPSSRPALRLHDQISPIPLERGRTLLLLGAVQRRLKQRAAARASCGGGRRCSTASARRCGRPGPRTELARISGRAPSPQDLTATERQVAELVARGMSNRAGGSRAVRDRARRGVHAHQDLRQARPAHADRAGLAAA